MKRLVIAGVALALPAFVPHEISSGGLREHASEFGERDAGSRYGAPNLIRWVTSSMQMR